MRNLPTGKGARSMRFLRRSLVGIFLFFLTLSALALAAKTVFSSFQERWTREIPSRPERERVFAVDVVIYEPGTIAPVMTSYGEVRSRRTLELRARVTGTVQELAESFEDGGRVEAGELLLRVDPSDARSALDIAMTDVREARAELHDAERALELARDDLESAREQASLRARALERQESLLGRGVGTETAVESAALAAAQAEQQVLAKRQALAMAEAGADQAGTSLERRRIALSEAERRLSDTELFAEFDGMLSAVGVVEGGLVQNNERVARLVDPRSLEVAFRISTAEYARLLDADGRLLDAKVVVELDSTGVDLKANGRVSRESAEVGEGQTGRALFARLEEADGFRPGDFVAVRVVEPELRDVASLPATALDSGNAVLVIGEDGRLETAEVELLRRQGDEVIVRSADLPGREVVVERTPLLGKGIKVRAIRRGAADGAAEPEMVELTAERRARLVAFVEQNRFMPDEAKKRVLAQLAKDRVPARVVERIEARIGG